jgi:hypothetical protein
MNRRSILAVGGVGLLGSIAGCISLFNESSIEAEKTNFTKHEGWHLAVIQNNRSRAVEVTLTTTGDQSDINYSNTLTVEASESEQITDLFTNKAESLILRVETKDHEREQTIQSVGREAKSIFEIHPDRIAYQQKVRRAADITVSNHLESQATFKITVDPASSSESPVYDQFQLPADGFISFTEVFTIGNEYDVRVEVNGTTKSEGHRASSSNSVSITLTDDGLELGEAER